MRKLLLISVALAALLFVRCSGENEANGEGDKPAPSVTENGQPLPEKKPRKLKRILIDQIVVSFKGAKKGTYGATRTKAEADKKIRSLLQRLKNGINFQQLKKAHSDVQDEWYFVMNRGFKHRARRDGIGVVSHEAFYPGPRKVAFSLKPGEFGLAEYNERACPDGYRIVIRYDAAGREYE